MTTAITNGSRCRQSYVMETARFQGSTPIISALATGDIDIPFLGFLSVPLAIQNAGLSDARVIVDEIQDGVPGYFTQPFLVRKASAILATNAVGSAVDIAMRAMLTKHRLDPNKDVTIVEAAFPNMKAMLAEPKVDLVPSVLPFPEDPELNAQSRVLFTQRDAMGRSELGIWVARQALIMKNRAALVDFLEDHLRMVRFYTDPANHSEAVKIVSKFQQAFGRGLRPLAILDGRLLP